MANYSAYGDEQLVELLKKGSEAAFTEIYDRYWKKLYSIVFERLKNHHDTQEIVQVVFLNLWRRRKNLELKYSLYTFLSAAVKYEVINVMAAYSRRSRVFSACKFYQEESVIENRLDVKELEEIIYQLINQLPEKSKQIFLLSRQSGLTNRAIANTLGLAEKTIEGHITTVLNRLRSAINTIWALLFSLLFHQF